MTCALVFESVWWKFYNDGSALYKVLQAMPNRAWVVDADDYGVASVWWVWQDNTMSLADPDAQQAYCSYLSRLVVAP